MEANTKTPNSIDHEWNGYPEMFNFSQLCSPENMFVNRNAADSADYHHHSHSFASLIWWSKRLQAVINKDIKQ